MELFKGLPARQMEVLRRASHVREFGPGTVIFAEGEPAYGLFTVVKGEVEIYRKNDSGDIRLTTIGPGGVFGEMGLIRDVGTRTAYARAMVDSLVYELEGNPVQLLESLGDHDAGIRLMQNLICVLAERLRGKDRPAAVRVGHAYHGVFGDALEGPLVGAETDSELLLAAIDSYLPKGFLRDYLSTRKLEKGEYLCVEGDEPDGFYFLREGHLEVLKGERGKEQRALAELYAPAVVGDVGFFAGEKRSASLRALSPLVYTYFSARDYEKLKKTDPVRAFRLLFAVAQLTIWIVTERETAK